ncbi:MAG: hypothetical protein MJE12_20375 [Alphaproteobacteria bacterium]|nr:hypothetical protein [Alphaproteobacteria bacterium]
MPIRTAIAALLALALLSPSHGDAADLGAVMERNHRGIKLVAFPAPSKADFDVSVMAPKPALARFVKAIDLIYRKSPRSARRIDALRKSGFLLLAYFPNNFRNRTRLNNQNVALFLPDFLKRRGVPGRGGKQFIVVINHFGVKWPVRELAAVIVHELVGHGGQHLRGHIANGRMLDLECEASLHEEQAYQDFGLAKKSRSMVLFRRQMENRYCSDFRAYMRHRMPREMALWDRLNPDVPALLRHFATYRRDQSAILKRPQAAELPTPRK